MTGAGSLSKALALVVAVAVVVLYFTLADRLRPGVAREIAWVAAVSQAIVMLVPVLVILIGTLTLIAIAVHRAYPALSPDTSEAASSRT